MCGIGGYIGESKHPEATHQLMTAMFERLESRGTDAAGFWGTESGDKGKILYHKEPVKSSEFVKKAIWAKLGQSKPNLLLCHARGASAGVGHPSTNRNNHPFVSADYRVSLIHNGRIPDSEYDVLAKKYETFSKCDSEILLRIFEQAEDFDDSLKAFDTDAQISHRLQGLSNIWSQILKGHMAVGIGEQLDAGNRRLWLFRNKYRPIWLMDMRKTLGQIFFCSLPEIWQDAVIHSPLAQPHLKKKTKLIEVPTEEIWTLDLNDKNEIGVRKFDVCTQGYVSSTYQGKPLSMIKQPITNQVITRLDQNENVVSNYNNGNKTYSSNSSTSGGSSRPLAQPGTSNTTTGGTAGVEVSRGISFEDESLKLATESSSQKKNEDQSAIKVSIVENNDAIHTLEDDGFQSRDAAFDKLAQDAYEAEMAAHEAASDDGYDEDNIDSDDPDVIADEDRFLEQELDKEFQRNQVGTKGDTTLSDLSDKLAGEEMRSSGKVSYSAIVSDLNKIREFVQRIENTTQIKTQTNELTINEYNDLMTSLEQVQLDLDGTLQILEN